MPITISQAYIETFEATVRHLAQQQQSKLRGAVTEVMKQSQTHNWDRLSASVGREKTSARMVSPAGGNGSGAVGSTDGLEWTRRQTLIRTFDTGEVIEQEDIVQMLIDPKSAAAQNLVMNMRRRIDDVIIEAATGDSLDGSGTPVTFPTGQVVGDYTGELTLDFVLEVDEKFMNNDIDPDEERYIVVGPRQRRKLLQLIEVVSGDYQDRKALATGYLPNFLGWNWIISTRLNIPAVDQIDCFAMTRKALGLHVASDISVQAAPRPDMSFAWQLYLSQSLDCKRVEDEHLVWMKLADTIT